MMGRKTFIIIYFIVLLVLTVFVGSFVLDTYRQGPVTAQAVCHG